jgi:predicted permease
MIRDLRFAWRLLARNPAFAFASLTVMAIGIGATTAVFTVVRGVLLRPLPYRQPDRVVLFRADGPGISAEPLVTGEELAAIRARTDLFESVAVINESPTSITTADDMEEVTGVSASDNFLDTLGMKPLLGRTVNRGDFGEQWVSSVVVSYELWQRHWHGDRDVIGQPIEINNIPMIIVGVMPRGFRLYLGSEARIPTRVDIWFPRGAGYDEPRVRVGLAIARLKDGVPLSRARGELGSTIARLVASSPASYPAGPVTLSMTTLDQDVVSGVRPALLAVAGAVAFVLLVGCANLTNLLLARASARTRELAVRTSIGATRGQIARQLIAEGLVLGAIGAAGGLLLAQWGVDGLLQLAPAALPRRETVVIDAGVGAFAAAISFATALLATLPPLWQATRSDVTTMLKNDPGSSPGARLTRGALVASQLALSLVLLVGAGLMIRAFVSMRNVPLGFDPSHAVTMNVQMQSARFSGATSDESRVKRLAFYHALTDATRQIPGVQQAGVGLFVPLSGGPITQRYATGPGAPERPADAVIALAGFLETLRVPLLEGRYFTREDDLRPVAIVDRQLAAETWPNQSPIGRRLLLPNPYAPAVWLEVVGVVEHVQLDGLRSRALPELFVTYATRQYSGLNVVARGPNPAALIPAVEAAVQNLGPGRPVHDVRLIEDYVADASADTRFALFVLGAFAALAVVLTAIGVYGVVAYATARRTREIAVRLALGASPHGLVGLVVRDGAVWTIVGLAAGLAGAAVLTRYLNALLFKVGPHDAATFLAVGMLLAVVAIAASVVPALRAIRVDPMLALRSE